MNEIYQLITLLLFSYLFGSIPTGYIIAKTKGIDITKQGSGNIGTANVIRTLGTKYGIIVLIFDSFKGFLPTFIAIKLSLPLISILLVSLFSIIGHIFSVFLKFKGGKGVATSLGTIIAISPILAISSFLVWLITVLITRYSSLGSILASIWATSIVILYQINIINYELFNIKINQNEKFILTSIITFLAIFIIYKHKENIKRILKNTENKLF